MRYIYLLLLLLTNLYSYSYNVVTSDSFNPIKDDGYDYSLYSNYNNTSVVDDGDYYDTYYKNDLIFNDKVYSSCYNVFTSKSSPCIVDENGYGVIMLGSDSNFESYSMLDSINRAYFDPTYINGSYSAVWGRANHRDPYYEFYLEPECGQDCDELRAEYLYYDNLNYKVVLTVSDNIYYNYDLRKFIYFYPYKVEESINDSGFFDGVDNFFTSAKYSFSITENSTRYTCPVGSKFNPNTGLCVKDCTDYDVSDSEFKFQFDDGKCLVVTGATSNYDIAKAYCEFKGSSFTITGADPYAPGTSSIMYYCANYSNMIQLPDDLFKKAPEVDNKDDNTDKPSGGSTDNQENGSTTNQGNSGSSSGGGSGGGSSSGSSTDITGGSSSGSNSGDNDGEGFTQTETTVGGNGSSDSNSTSGNNPGGGSGSGGVGTDGTDGNGADQGGESEGEGIGNTDKEAVEGALGGLGGVFDGIFDSFFELGNSLDEMLTNLENSVNSVKDSLKPFGSISATTVTTCPLDFSYSSPYPINFSIDLCTPLYSVNGLVYSIIFLSILSLSVIFFIKILIMLLATF